MKRDIWTALAIACMASAIGSGAQAQEFEFKGLHIGMTEAEFKKLNPKAQCGKSAIDPAWPKEMQTRRTCSVPKYTVASKETTGSQFLFFDGKLGRIVLNLYGFHADDVRSSLAAKYGPFITGGGRDTAEWQLKTVSMKLIRDGEIAMLFVHSPLSDDWDRMHSEFKTKKGKADL